VRKVSPVSSRTRTVHRKRDANQPGIVKALEDAGVKVYLLDDPLDLLCGLEGRWVLMEIKNRHGKTSGGDLVGVKGARDEWADIDELYPGRARYLRKSQAQFIRDYHGQGGEIAIVFDEVEALAVFGLVTP
jgi:hypothetical protein